MLFKLRYKPVSNPTLSAVQSVLQRKAAGLLSESLEIGSIWHVVPKTRLEKVSNLSVAMLDDEGVPERSVFLDMLVDPLPSATACVFSPHHRTKQSLTIGLLERMPSRDALARRCGDTSRGLDIRSAKRLWRD
jgi:hypothetical protein